MITIQNVDGAIKFTFSGNSTYLQDGTIEAPLNSLMLVTDSSNMATFKKAASNDIFVSATYDELGMTKDELVTWFEENAVGGTGGGGGDITSGEVQTMIDESISGKVDASSIVSAITSASTDSEIPSAKLVYDIIAEDEEVTARAIAELNEKKLDASAYTPTDLSEYWTSAQTESAIEASVSGKVATSDFEAYSGTVANEYVSKAENTVSATTIFVNFQDNYSNQNYSENIVRSATFDYRGDKTSATSQEVYFSIVDLDTWTWYNGYVYFDYTNGTYTKDDSLNILDVTYDSSIEDFRINVSDNYPNCNISNVRFNGGYIRVPFSTIASGQSANVIQTSIANIFGDVYSKNLDALTTCIFSINENNNKKIILFYSNGRLSNIEGSSLYLEDLKAENRNGFNYLSSDINISLGTSGWTEVTNLSRDSCNTNYLGNIKPFTMFRISGDASNLSLWGLQIAVGSSWSYYWDNIRWDENENTFVREAGWSPDVFSAATVNWDSNTNYLTISYPDTFILDGQERQTELYYINSQQCQYGYAITKFEYYAEQTQPIKPYVQQLRTDVNTISGQVSSKISTSAITSAVTSASTDSEIPTAKAVYDAIPTGGTSITVDPSLDSGSTNAVANSAITAAIANATDGRLKEDLVFSGSCGYGTIHANVGMVGDNYLIINTYPSTKISFAVFRSSNKNYRYEIVIQDIATKDTYRAYYYYTYNTITSSGGTGINYATISYRNDTQTFTANDGYRIIGLVRDMAGSGREHYRYICTYNANIPSGTTLSELYGYITNVNANLKGLTKGMYSAIDYQNYADEYGGELYYQQTVFPTNDSFTGHTASTVMHTTQAEKDSWNGKVDASAITTSVTSGSTDSEIPSAKAVYDVLSGKQDTLIAGTGIDITDNVISATGGGGFPTEKEETISDAINYLDEKKLDATAYTPFEASRYDTKKVVDFKIEQAVSKKVDKVDAVTNEQLKEELAKYETLVDETNVEEAVAYALNDLNQRLTAIENYIANNNS